MAIQINPRTAIIAGVVVLAAAGAGVWFFMFEEDAPPPKVVTVPPPGATKAAAATTAAVKDAVKAAEGAPKAAAQPGKPAAAKPAAIPADPDKLVMEIIVTSGLRNQIRSFAAEVASSANSASQPGQEGQPAMDSRAVTEIAARHFEPDAMMADLVQGLKASYEAERMGRFLELLRSPIALKMSAIEGRPVTREERAQFAENFRKNPPSAARQKLILTIDEVSRSSELGLAIATLTAREMVDALFDGLQKAGKRPPKEARQLVNSQIGAAEPQIRSGFRTLLHITYRDVGDEELAEYVKLLDSETGRWGGGVMVSALRPAVEKRVRPFARDMANLALQQQLASKSTTLKDAAAAAPVGKEAEKAAPAKVAVVAAPPAEVPGYQRPAGIRQLYSRHNDLVTAVVMRDQASVKELLADGKNPDARQSDGFTPLMIAASNGDTAIAEMLLARRADPNLRTPDGHTALSLARKSNAAGMVQLLQRSGARS